MNPCARLFRRGPLVVMCLASVSASVFAQGPEEYILIDRVEGANIQMNSAPIRPLTISSTAVVWAVNTQDSTIERFDPVPGAMPGDVFPPVVVRKVPWGPVSIARWDGGTTTLGDQLLVVCRGTWGLLRMDEATGEYTAFTRLPGEPSDIVVDPVRDRAFVSCMGADAVVEIDLVNQQPTVDHTYVFPDHLGFLIKSPLFLSLDLTVPTDPSVLVAPLHSGNNSTPSVIGSSLVGPTVLDLTDEVNVVNPGGGLPDFDLLRIQPGAVPGAGTVTVVARNMGTLLFAHGVHPTTGDFWQLNTEANNKDPALQSEPAIKGDFVFNRLTIVPDLATQVLPVTATDTEFTNFDDLGEGEVIGQPFAMAFHPNSTVFVTGMLTDNITHFFASGNRFREWDLPDGSIPRGMVTFNNLVLTYCWGTNQIVIQNWTAPDPTTTNITLQLRHDPTPPDIARGREIFFDASHSERGNASCASCHFDGGTDFLVWNLSNLPKDNKGPMFTQTLVGLERLEPFHWRAERDLEDFNKAFKGLLGASQELSDDDFADFKSFLFSLKNPANPFQNADRILDSGIHHPRTETLGADATVGQQLWSNSSFILFNQGFTCVGCHTLATGSNNDITPCPPNVLPQEQSRLKATAFHELWRKTQLRVPINLQASGVELRAFTGAGVSHAGAIPDLLDFTTFNTVQGPEHRTDFMHQFDQGLGRAVHWGVLLDLDNHTIAQAQLTYLQEQLDDRNCDVVVMGQTDVSGTLQPMRWAWDRFLTTPAFVPENPEAGLSTRQFGDFINAIDPGAGTPQESNLFVGLPVGMGYRFGVDYDSDGLLNGVEEGAAALEPAPGDPLDLTPPTFVSPPAIDWATTKVARLRFDTSELTTARVTYTDLITGDSQVITSDLPARTHGLTLTGLRASTSTDSITPSGAVEFVSEDVRYDVDTEIFDLGDPPNPNSFEDLTFQTAPFILPIDHFANPLDPGDRDEFFDPTTEGDDRQFLHAHFVRALTFTLRKDLVPQASVKGTVNVTVTFRQGAMEFDGSQWVKPAAPRRLVIARVYHQPKGSDTVTAIPDVTPLNQTIRVDSVRLDVLGLGTNPCGTPQAGAIVPDLQPGPYLIHRTLTDDLTGQVTFEFDTPAGLVQPGDKVLFNIEAIVEIPEVPPLPAIATPVAANFQTVLDGLSAISTCELPLPADNAEAYSQWDFPTTQEARACIARTYRVKVMGGVGPP
jgi:hypothetical protein